MEPLHWYHRCYEIKNKSFFLENPIQHSVHRVPTQPNPSFLTPHSTVCGETTLHKQIGLAFLLILTYLREIRKLHKHALLSAMNFQFEQMNNPVGSWEIVKQFYCGIYAPDIKTNPIGTIYVGTI